MPDSYHELLLEAPHARNACERMILNFFSQESDDVNKVKAIPPLVPLDESKYIFTMPELVFRAVGLTIAAIGLGMGVTLMVGGRSTRR